VNVYISADIEGVAGIAAWEQVLPGHEDYPIGRRLMAGEVNAAIAGAFEAGATRVVVNDSHATMTNLIPDEIDPRAELILGRYKPMYMLEGLDGSFDAAFFIGYHGAIGAPHAVLSHSYSPAAIWESKVDGRVVGEIGINDLVCRHFGVPLVLVSGDQVTVQEARDLKRNVQAVQTKTSFSRFSASNLSPDAARGAISRGANAALKSLSPEAGGPGEATVELTFLTADMAESATWVKGVEAVGPRQVRFTSPDGLTAYRTFYTILRLMRSIPE